MLPLLTEAFHGLEKMIPNLIFYHSKQWEAILSLIQSLNKDLLYLYFIDAIYYTSVSGDRNNGQIKKYNKKMGKAMIWSYGI